MILPPVDKLVMIPEKFFKKLKYKKLPDNFDKLSLLSPPKQWNLRRYPVSEGKRYPVIAVVNDKLQFEVCRVSDLHEGVRITNGLNRYHKALRTILKSVYGKEIKIETFIFEDKNYKLMLRNPTDKRKLLDRLSIYLEPHERDLLGERAERHGIMAGTLFNLLFQSLRSVFFIADYQVKERSNSIPRLGDVKKLKDYLLSESRNSMSMSMLTALRCHWLGERASVQDALDVFYDAIKSGVFTRGKGDVLNKRDTLYLREEHKILGHNKNLKPIGVSDDEGDTDSMDDIQDDFDEEET